MSSIIPPPPNAIVAAIIESVREEEEAILHLLQMHEQHDVEGLVAAAEWLKSVRAGVDTCAD